ncbi:MAG TPA: translation initiation factor IF-2 [bacterium]|jgi:translation initiation factor IF-2|nr:translation initiation factor IF-2 [bacterium]
MGKQRIYELAKRLEISSKELLELLAEMGVEAKSHMSTLDRATALQVLASLGEGAPISVPKPDAEVEKSVEKAKEEIRTKERKNRIKQQKNGLKKPKEPRPSDLDEAQNTKTITADTGVSLAEEIRLPNSLTVQELSTLLKRPGGQIVKLLFDRGVMAGLNQAIDYSVAAQVAEKLGFKAMQTEEQLPILEEVKDHPDQLRDRPPVVTVLGHVDHGKTSLLDAIRHTKVTIAEAGGITQHIGASVVTFDGRDIVFLDTPGHEAFTALRARGAQVTDLAILVIAADDGIMPQTVEAINHARAAKVPIIVVINKIDKPGARPDMVKQQLTEYELIPEEWGGDTICLSVSAKQKQGIEDLLEMILLMADMQELKANPKRQAVGTIIEAELDRGRGPVASVLVQRGTLYVGDAIVAGTASGRVRAMTNDKGSRVGAAGPSVPVEVQGFSEVPQAGDIMRVVEDEKTARSLAEAERHRLRETELQTKGGLSLNELYLRVQEGKVKELNLIIKGDVQGSVEAIEHSLERLSTSEVKVNVIHTGVGTITETDIMLAAASKAVIIGFNVRPEGKATQAAEAENIDIRLYRIIYDAIEDVKAAMEGMLAPKIREVSLGQAEVRTIFHVPKAGTIAGSYVKEGKISRDAQARLVRDGIVIHEGPIGSLRRFKDDVGEVAAGYECGIGLANYQDIKAGDIVEVFRLEEIPATL